MLQTLKNAYQEAGIRTAVIGASLLAPVMAFAQATDPFDAALTSVTEKTETYASALVGVAAVAVVFMIAVKYVKKLPRAS